MLQRYKINVTVLYFYTEKNQKNALHSLSHVLQDYNLIFHRKVHVYTGAHSSHRRSGK